MQTSCPGLGRTCYSNNSSSSSSNKLVPIDPGEETRFKEMDLRQYRHLLSNSNSSNNNDSNRTVRLLLPITPIHRDKVDDDPDPLDIGIDPHRLNRTGRCKPVVNL